MRIALLELYTPELCELARAADYNKRDYCALHGYDLIIERQTLDPARPGVWSKILALIKHLERYEWVLWTDIDALIMDLAARLEPLCDPAFEVIITQDMHGINI